MTVSLGIQELTKKIDASGTRRAFAESVEISEAYLSQILSGKQPIEKLPLATVRRISTAAGISIDRLASNEPDQKKRWVG